MRQRIARDPSTGSALVYGVTAGIPDSLPYAVLLFWDAEGCGERGREICVISSYEQKAVSCGVEKKGVGAVLRLGRAVKPGKESDSIRGAVGIGIIEAIEPS
jgi:hypothetical protein